MKERETLIVEATTAWRQRDPSGRILPHPAWADLDVTARIEAFDVTSALRAMEAALDSEGLSSTVRLIMGRIAGMR